MRWRSRSFVCLFLAFGLAFSAALSEPRRKRGERRAAPSETAFDAAEADDAGKTPTLHPGNAGSSVLRAQVLLDRAHFSPGEIDGRFRANTRRAVAALQKEHGVEPDGVLGPETWRLLDGNAAPVVVSYTISQEDVAGPFFEIPDDMMEKAKLPALGYASAVEGIAEKFHASPSLLQKLNPGKTLDQAGEQILVPGVERDPPGKAARVIVDASERAVYALDRRGRVLARYPASVGSRHDPLPVGKWKIRGRRIDPEFHYNPDLFWDADAASAKVTIAPGPNNPVGLVWIDLSKRHHGIHGTPEPSQIGQTQSHGCIRLTNWDVVELARMVSPGTPAILRR